MASVGPLESWLLSHDFVMDKPGSWSAPQAGAFCTCVMAALGFLNNIVPPVARALLRGASPIPAQGSHLDALEWKDHLFLFINRLASIPFTYHFVVTAWTLPSIVWCVAGGGGGGARRAAWRELPLCSLHRHPGCRNRRRCQTLCWPCPCSSCCTTCFIRSSTERCT